MASDTIAPARALTPGHPNKLPARQRLHAPLATLDDRLSEADVAATLRFAEASRSANTRLAYDADWRAFVSWCSERGGTPLPCSPGLLCGHLSSLAEAGLRASTIGRRASGIAHVHRLNGHEPPTAGDPRPDSPHDGRLPGG